MSWQESYIMTINELKKSVDNLLSSGTPFAIIRRPGADPQLIVENSKAKVSITDWHGDDFTLNVVKPLSAPIAFKSTKKEDYIASIEQLISRLKERKDAKTVFSRVQAVDASNVDWGELAFELWANFPQSYGFIFFTPATGAWIGASPELLLEVKSDRTFFTQALAGTLPVESEWDNKNIVEQRIVADYISTVLNSKGIPFTKEEPEDVIYGRIKHLSTKFRGQLPEKVNVKEVLRVLAPTPALAGFPKETALKDIEELENHNRGCYGGYITLSDEISSLSFVIIRCMHFDVATGQTVVYSGGGITSESIAENEWSETELKAQRLMELINCCSK